MQGEKVKGGKKMETAQVTIGCRPQQNPMGGLVADSEHASKLSWLGGWGWGDL